MFQSNTLQAKKAFKCNSIITIDSLLNRIERRNMNELVYLKNDEAVCTSLEVAKRFGKRHDNVIQAIRGLLENEDTQIMFKKSSYIEEQNGQTYPMYLMNRDGFSLLVMGFTGKKALEWKINYIKAFNTMEAILAERRTTTGQATIEQNKENRLRETDEIKKFVEYAKQNGSKNADRYYILYSNLANSSAGIIERKLATIAQLNQLTLIENIILNQIRFGIEQEMYYKDIFKKCKAQIELFKNVAFIS